MNGKDVELPPFRAPVLFWAGAGVIVVSNFGLLVAFAKSVEPSPGIVAILMGLGFALIGWFAVLNPERTHRLAPYYHRDVADVSLLGWIFVGVGVVVICIGGLLLAPSSLLTTH